MTYQINDVPGRLDDLSDAATSAGSPTMIGEHRAPERLVDIATAIAAELPAAAARLGSGRTAEAISAAIGLGVAIDGVIAQPAGPRPEPEAVAQLAADLAGRIGLLLLDAAIEAVAGDAAPEHGDRAEQAVQALIDGIVAIRSELGYTDAAERWAA